ncbi:hypothetical protein PHMEG_00012181 [Phytophthora megakarya]|uniref:Uncharacterized protein n=1 Tax=Phytophthora megakarya TaxID=4795 RepID=A0A225W9D9_9STRA|nr:hypothetical protein PHMEG_00012181 [Phytophthora megakarya]
MGIFHFPFVKTRKHEGKAKLELDNTCCVLRHTTLKPIGQDQLLDALGRLTRRVKAVIKAEMPRLGALNSEHFLAVFWRCEHGGKPCSPLFALTPLINQEGDDHSAGNHVTFLSEMLMRDYDKRLDDGMFIEGDNCSTNRRLVTLVGVPLVGSLNLAVQSILVAFKDDLDQVRELMVKLKSLNQSKKLRKISRLHFNESGWFKILLRPVLRQQTRWSSAIAMVNRYVNLLKFINDDDDLADYLPSSAANRWLRKLLDE